MILPGVRVPKVRAEIHGSERIPVIAVGTVGVIIRTRQIDIRGRCIRTGRVGSSVVIVVARLGRRDAINSGHEYTVGGKVVALTWASATRRRKGATSKPSDPWMTMWCLRLDRMATDRASTGTFQPLLEARFMKPMRAVVELEYWI